MIHRPLVLNDGKISQLPIDDLLEGQDNFSFTDINQSETVRVPNGQEMLHSKDVTVSGDLVIDGDVHQHVDWSLWSFGWNKIRQGLSLLVSRDRDFLYYRDLTIDGDLIVDGRIIEV